MKSKYSAVPSLWALACAAALAQQTPAPETKPAGEEKPAPSGPKLDIGYGTWGLSGNESTFRRFTTLPKGLFVRELSYGFYQSSPGMFGDFMFRGRPSEDYTVDTTDILDSKTRFQASADNSQFMEPSQGDIPTSRRRNVEGSLQRTLGQNLNLVLSASSTQHDKFFEGPAFPVHTRTDNFGAQIAGDVGKGGRMEVALNNRRFFDRANFQPDSNAQTWSGTLSHPFGMLDLEGSYAQTTIEQDGRSDAKVKNWNLDGGIPLGANFDVQFGMRRQKYELPQVANAYVRDRFTSYARVVGNFAGMSGHLSYKHVETERVREDHSFVDVPKFNTLEGRLSGNFGTGPRWTIRGSWQNLDDDAKMLTSDPRRLFWDDKVKLQFKLDHGGTNWGAYAAYNYGFQENEMRDIKIRTHGFVMGGSYQWKSNVDFFGELGIDKGNTDFTEPGATVGLDSFFPSSRVLTLGSNWAISPNTSLTTSYTELVTDNDNPIFDPLGNVYSRFVSASLNHRTKEGYELGFLIAPGKYADRVIRSLGYQATVVQLTAKWRF